MDINECLQRCIAEQERIPMRPPTSFAASRLPVVAMQAVGEDSDFQERMRMNGFDPGNPTDALLALAIAFAASQVPTAG
ncbi:MAG TPA: hypothetical protein VD887_01860 [Allosphingosinicella sp.]|nr:hypothetical protein [Allosphingosinicella sp.]